MGRCYKHVNRGYDFVATYHYRDEHHTHIANRWGGLGHSIQKYQYLPESIGDAIFAIIAEEFGFLATTLFLGVFLIFIGSGFKIALASRTRFGTLLGIGIVSWIGLQTLINISGVMGVFPLTGMPLPFISYGGTALALELGAVGVLSSIARN